MLSHCIPTPDTPSTAAGVNRSGIERRFRESLDELTITRFRLRAEKFFGRQKKFANVNGDRGAGMRRV